MLFHFKQHLLSIFRKQSTELGAGDKEMNNRDPDPHCHVTHWSPRGSNGKP